MKESKAILNHGKLRQKPTVPSEFFATFFDSLMQEIDQESSVIGQLKKRELPEIPENYFENNLDFLNEVVPPASVLDIQLSQKPVVPVHFFDEFPSRIATEIEANESGDNHKSNTFKLWLIGGFSAVAATFILFFTLRGVNPPLKNQTPLVEDQTEEAFDAYLSYLDEDELIDFIIEANIEVETNSGLELNDQNLEDYTIEDLEDYYLEML